MKVAIFIDGQINGNFILADAIGGERRKIMYGFKIPFNSKKEAVKAIRKAYNSLCNDEPQAKGKLGGIRANRNRTALYYDASKAVILND